MTQRQRVLVTGMSGLIGGLVGRALARDYEVRALNRRPIEGVDCFQADINDLEAIRPAFEGVHAVAHMAAYLGPDVEGQLATNIRGVYNVFEAAREAGLRRIVFASSGSTVRLYEDDEGIRALTEARWDDVPDPRPVIDHTVPVRPLGVYGAAKVFGEALGRHYAESFGISVLCIRIGRVVEEDRPADAWHASCYVSHRDIVQMVERCVKAPESLKFDIFYAVSDNRGRYRDIEHARDVVGYVPQDGIRDWPPAGS